MPHLSDGEEADEESRRLEQESDGDLFVIRKAMSKQPQSDSEEEGRGKGRGEGGRGEGLPLLLSFNKLNVLGE